MTDHNTQYTQEVVCPHCGHEMHDAWEVDFGDSVEGEAHLDCGECGGEFIAYRTVSISYSTYKKNGKDIVNGQ